MLISVPEHQNKGNKSPKFVNEYCSSVINLNLINSRTAGDIINLRNHQIQRIIKIPFHLRHIYFFFLKLGIRSKSWNHADQWKFCSYDKVVDNNFPSLKRLYVQREARDHPMDMKMISTFIHFFDKQGRLGTSIRKTSFRCSKFPPRRCCPEYEVTSLSASRYFRTIVKLQTSILYSEACFQV